MPRVARLSVIASLLVAGLLVVACSPRPDPADDAPTPSVDRSAVMEMARTALEGFNAGEYAAWSRDWSPTMRAAIDEKAFLSFRDRTIAQVGRYVSIEDATLASVKPGTHRWVFTVRFERATVTVSFGFIDGQTAIEGVTLG